MRTRIAVALSGGVDSAVAAARLQDAGYTVLGLHGTEWSGEWAGPCAAAPDAEAARSVAERLGIEFHRVHCERAYRAEVFAGFLAELARGATPNPDVDCNRRIKFGLLADAARALGAVALATGHYARTRRVGSDVRLYAGIDPDKDQSYFLSLLTEEQLRFARFPLGSTTKRAVRAEARARGLPVADRPDSMGLCFVGTERFRAFLRPFVGEQTGVIADPSGRALGEHPGTAYFTIGQRRGLGLAGGPYYVAAKDPATRTLTVVRGRNHPRLLSSGVRIASMHWIHATPPAGTYRVRFRHQQPLAPARVEPNGSGATVRFRSPAWAATPGQVVTVYAGTRILGGGAITEVLP